MLLNIVVSPMPQLFCLLGVGLWFMRALTLTVKCLWQAKGTLMVWLQEHWHNVGGLGSGVVNDSCENLTVCLGHWTGYLEELWFLKRTHCLCACRRIFTLGHKCVCCCGGLQPCCYWFSSESSLFFWTDSDVPYFPLLSQWAHWEDSPKL